MPQIAKVLKSNGTDGGILIGVRDIEIGQIDLKEPVYIEFDGLPVPFFILDLQQKGRDKAVVHLNDVCNLQDAEELVGRAVFVEGEWEEEDEEDFTGWTVYDRGRRLGEVSGVEPIPGNLCLYVETDNGEAMIPLHEDFVLSVDEDKEELFLDLPEGL
ncbi:MAG: hypothetical protein KBS67_05870, partial [Bacteroidales bacterium]|nr:hypothetical protein [Candidatus Cryptobacteroides equifaecalis]